MKRLSLMLAAVVVFPWLACEPESECVDGEFQCVGPTARNCGKPTSEDDYARWYNQTCSFTCVEDGTRANCTLSDQPIPECMSSDGSEVRICINKLATRCVGGYPIAEGNECPVTCIEHGTTAFCAESTEPDPRCPDPAAQRSAMCEGNTVLEFTFGYLTRTFPCEEGRVCRVEAPDSAVCPLR